MTQVYVWSGCSDHSLASVTVFLVHNTCMDLCCTYMIYEYILYAHAGTQYTCEFVLYTYDIWLYMAVCGTNQGAGEGVEMIPWHVPTCDMTR